MFFKETCTLCVRREIRLKGVFRYKHLAYTEKDRRAQLLRICRILEANPDGNGERRANAVAEIVDTLDGSAYWLEPMK